MKTVLIILSLLCAAVATAVGFGWISGGDLSSDWPGWIGLTLFFFVAAHLPLER